jgi:tRNA (adenine57-N1/adenine58-N1)-methyltransferase
MESYGGWTDVEVTEILMRRYKPVADRLRPEDRMIAHTGYLLFARAVSRELPGLPAIAVDGPEATDGE